MRGEWTVAEMGGAGQGIPTQPRRPHMHPGVAHHNHHARHGRRSILVLVRRRPVF